MVIKRKFKRGDLWISCNTGQFGLGVHITKWVPFAMRNYKCAIEIYILFLRIIISMEKKY